MQNVGRTVQGHGGINIFKLLPKSHELLPSYIFCLLVPLVSFIFSSKSLLRVVTLLLQDGSGVL